jgi:hypothetical protein
MRFVRSRRKYCPLFVSSHSLTHPILLTHSSHSSHSLPFALSRTHLARACVCVCMCVCVHSFVAVLPQIRHVCHRPQCDKSGVDRGRRCLPHTGSLSRRLRGAPRLTSVVVKSRLRRRRCPPHTRGRNGRGFGWAASRRPPPPRTQTALHGANLSQPLTSMCVLKIRPRSVSLVARVVGLTRGRGGRIVAFKYNTL